MGLIYIYLSPPFQVPDSPNHFFRTYQLATGQITPSHDNNTVGGWVPNSFHQLQETFTPYRYNAYHKMEHEVLDSVKEIELNEQEKVYMHFPNTGVYSPVSYIPQTIAMRIGLWLKMKPINIYYLVRVFSFLCWFGMIVLTFRFLPIKKLLFGVLVLLPMSLFINTSFSADMMINGMSWLYLALVLNLALTERKLTVKYGISLIILIILIGLAKLVYIPIVAVLLIVPFIKFGGKLRMLFFVLISILLGFGSASLWKSKIDTFYYSYFEYNSAYRDNVTLGYKSDVNKQIEYIKLNKLNTIKIFSNSFFRDLDDLLYGYIGNIGWNRFQFPLWFILFSYGIILLFTFSYNTDEYFLSIKQKIILLGIATVLIFLVILSQYLIWVPVGHNEVWNISSRYFFPVFPMLFLTLSFKVVKINKQVGILIFTVYTILVTVYSSYCIVDSFYVNNELELAWEEDFGNKSIDFLQNEHTFEFGKIQGNSNVKLPPPLSTLGNWIELSPENPFGYTVSFSNVKKGDKVMVEAWRTSENVKFVFDDQPTSKYYTTTCHSTKQYVGEFELIQETYFCFEDFKTLKVYMYNPSGDTSHVRDFRIKYYKSKN